MAPVPGTLLLSPRAYDFFETECFGLASAIRNSGIEVEVNRIPVEGDIWVIANVLPKIEMTPVRPIKFGSLG